MITRHDILRLWMRLRRALVFFVMFGAVMLSTASAGIAMGEPVALSVRSTGDENITRLVLEFEGHVDMNHQVLAHPERLVLDFPKIGYGFSGDSENFRGLVKHMRWGDMSNSVSRMIFDIAAPFAVTSIKSEADGDSGKVRYFVDLEQIDASAFRAEIDRTLKTGAITRTTQKSDRVGTTPPVSKPAAFTVIIDPGHGGIDVGAKGRNTLEKDIVLQFGREIRDAIEATGVPMNIFMTRDSDVFVPLDERVHFARQHNASLLISIHADSVRQSYVRGSTVYTISEKASDSLAAEIAESENSSDLIAGISLEHDDHEVADILIDLTRRETLGFSVQFARLAIGEIKKVTKLINNPHRHAGFKVLRAHDVPSVLVEMGYLSNAEDEELMNDRSWRQSVAEKLAAAVVAYANQTGYGLQVGAQPVQ